MPNDVFYILNIYFMFIYMYVSACLLCVCTGPPGGQKMALDLLELELQVVWSCVVVLGLNSLRSSGRASVTLNGLFLLLIGKYTLPDSASEVRPLQYPRIKHISWCTEVNLDRVNERKWVTLSPNVRVLELYHFGVMIGDNHEGNLRVQNQC